MLREGDNVIFGIRDPKYPSCDIFATTNSLQVMTFAVFSVQPKSVGVTLWMRFDLEPTRRVFANSSELFMNAVCVGERVNAPPEGAWHQHHFFVRHRACATSLYSNCSVSFETRHANAQHPRSKLSIIERPVTLAISVKIR